MEADSRRRLLEARGVEVAVGNRLVIEECRTHGATMPYAVMKISAVMVLIAANVVVYLVEGPPDGHIMTLFALWPFQPDADGQSYFHFWQIVTYAFLHDPHNVAHIGFNMLGVYMFGSEIERYAGPWRLLACYFASVITAALAQLLVPPLLGAPLGPRSAHRAACSVCCLLLP